MLGGHHAGVAQRRSALNANASPGWMYGSQNRDCICCISVAAENVCLSGLVTLDFLFYI